jgi:hypothetical protein
MLARMRWGSGNSLKRCSQLTSPGSLCVVKPGSRGSLAATCAGKEPVSVKIRSEAAARRMFFLR